MGSTIIGRDNVEEDEVVETDPTGRFQRYRQSLGRGAHKEVFKSYDDEEGVEVAWNQIRMNSFTSPDVNRIQHEIEILQSLRNDNIINLLYSWRAASSVPGKDDIYFITELMTSGTLKNYIRKAKGPIKPKIIRNWCRQILNGLHYLHTRDPPIIHRDLKCENIFINGNNGQAKIGDLGLAAIKATQHLSSVLGTPEFMAPELYDEKYDEKVDIYAFGLVVLEIATKEYPYSECSNQAQIYKKVMAGVKPAALSKVEDPETKAFIELCIEHDVEKRPSATDLLSHPFISQLHTVSSNVDIFNSFSISGLNSVKASPDQSFANIPVEQTPPLFTLDSISTKIEEDFEDSDSDKSDLSVNQAVIGSMFHISRHSTPLKEKTTCDVKVIEIVGDEVMLKMTYLSGKSSLEVKFPFNLADDTATDVVSELVKEKLIMAKDKQLTRRRIEETIRSVLMKKRDDPLPVDRGSETENSKTESDTASKSSDKESETKSDLGSKYDEDLIEVNLEEPSIIVETEKLYSIKAESEKVPIPAPDSGSSTVSSPITPISTPLQISIPLTTFSSSISPMIDVKTPTFQSLSLEIDNNQMKLPEMVPNVPHSATDFTPEIRSVINQPLDPDPHSSINEQKPEDKKPNPEIELKLKQLQELNMNMFDDSQRISKLNSKRPIIQ
ncbi:Serine/threonine-protein kinase wnk3 [Boothiomyces macroporosus]|uniref:Serine/threonine-protein kinase wnk3 n=1 Tax=Boothiomyces macroporosus TaxID=261099 RepID=A0AAD5Y9A1_9FUNG|nr:Serine/threonine-protein kinase wnk3 [Boothiomyces macroporosus]